MIAKTENGERDKLSALSASPWWSRFFVWAVVMIGVVLRLLRYCNGRSLWFDESLLALNILHRPIAGLFRPLDYHQGAPLGFLLLLKLATKAGGGGELVFRAIPLAASLISLFLFWRVAELSLSPRAVPAAMVLFSLSPTLIHFSSEAKQYSSDVAVTLVLLWATMSYARSTLTTSSLLKFCLVGTVAIWFSHPASFVLAAIIATLFAVAISEHNRTLLRQTLLTVGACSLSFLLCYFVSLRSLGADQALLKYWRDSFPPQPLASFTSLNWIAAACVRLSAETTGLVDFLAIALFTAGAWALVRTNRALAGYLIAPIGVTFLASLFGRYPLGGRLLLFLVPLLLMTIAEGVVWTSGVFGRFSVVLEAALLVVLLIKPISIDANEALRPDRGEDIKAVIRYIQAHQQPGDVWFIYHWARYQYWYYSELDKFSPANVHIGQDCGTDIACYNSDLDQLRGNRRVWILFSHVWIGDGLQEERISVQHLDLIGKRLDRFTASGSRAYLYDLSQEGYSEAH